MFCYLLYLAVPLAFLVAITFVQAAVIQPITDNLDFGGSFEAWGWWGCAFGIWGFHPQLLLSFYFLCCSI